MTSQVVTEVYGILKDAILNRRTVSAVYRGRTRIMSPHVLGTKRGRPPALFCSLLVRARPAWRRMDLRKTGGVCS
jgi:hypothetical protein